MSTDDALLTRTFRPRRVEKPPPCQLSCPNCGDIRGWIGVIAQRTKLGLSAEAAYTRAWQTITDVNPFPAVLGRICPHPCESRCNRSGYDEPLAVNAMERFLGDWAIGQRLPLVRRDDGPVTESIGVIGAGPSGLSLAYQLARRGYRVTVYERRPIAGGMLRFGIPDYRLPPEILDAEIQRILDLGVELKTGIQVGVHVTLDDLREAHDAVYVGVGAQKGRRLGIPGETGMSVWAGTEYLYQVNSGERVELGGRVAVVGGGNTAVDAARTARRAGADVTLVYRRSRTEMPAIAQEVDDALDEGVTLLLQTAPVRLERYEGRQWLIACRMELGEPDDSGRRRPVVVPDSEFAIPADSIVAAVSQEPDTTGLETLLSGEGRFFRDPCGSVADEVWAGGDVAAAGIAAEAIVQGRHAAEAIHARLRGRPDPAMDDARHPLELEKILMDFHEPAPATHPPRLPIVERLRVPRAEVTAGIGEEEFLAEANRCFSCGACFGCQHCAMYCTAQCFTRLAHVAPRAYYSLSLDQCEECGKCVAVCPCGYLKLASGA